MHKVETCFKWHFSICVVVGDSGKNSNWSFLRHDIIKWNISFPIKRQAQMLICFAMNFYFGMPLVQYPRILLKGIYCSVYVTLPQYILHRDDWINKQTTGATVVDWEDNSSKWCESENEHEHIGLQRGRGIVGDAAQQSWGPLTGCINGDGAQGGADKTNGSH